MNGISEDLYAEFKERDFGVEKVSVISNKLINQLALNLPVPLSQFFLSLLLSLFLPLFPILSFDSVCLIIYTKVTAIELLSMTYPPAKDHYYHCFQQYSFKETWTHHKTEL